MTDTMVAALTDDELYVLRVEHTAGLPYQDGTRLCQTCHDRYPCGTIRALDALDAAQRRVRKLEDDMLTIHLLCHSEYPDINVIHMIAHASHDAGEGSD